MLHDVDPARRRLLSTSAQLLAAGALIAWRAASPTWHPLREDALFLCALYWMFCLFARNTRAWPAVTGLLCALLGAIYLKGQIPHMLVVYDLLP